MKYKTASGMRIALEQRLKRIAKETSQDIMQLRRHVAFDRLLARIFKNKSSNFILKGGYALELRIDNARSTKDIDISFKGNLGGIWKGKYISDPNALQGLIQDISSFDMGDFFEFEIGSMILNLENAPYGGYRFPVDVQMAGRRFINFDIDIAAGDAWIEPHDIIQPTNWFDFAGINPPLIPIISKEQQFAEKLHTYTLPRNIPNSRVKDLVDLLILIKLEEMNPKMLLIALNKTFSIRGTHAVPPIFHDPPKNWTMPFKQLSLQCGIKVDLIDAVIEIKKYCLQRNLISEKSK